MRTTWKGVPKEVKELAGAFFRKYHHLFPSWVREFEVGFDEEMKDARATVVSDQVYGRVSIDFGSAWLTADDDTREWVIVHEILHTQIAPLERAFEELMEVLPKRIRPVAEKRFEGALEEVVSGLTFAVLRRTD